MGENVDKARYTQTPRNPTEITHATHRSPSTLKHARNSEPTCTLTPHPAHYRCSQTHALSREVSELLANGMVLVVKLPRSPIRAAVVSVRTARPQAPRSASSASPSTSSARAPKAAVPALTTQTSLRRSSSLSPPITDLVITQLLFHIKQLPPLTLTVLTESRGQHVPISTTYHLVFFPFWTPPPHKENSC